MNEKTASNEMRAQLSQFGLRALNTRFTFPDESNRARRSGLLFSLQLTSLGLISVAMLWFASSLIARMDVAFLEANGMIQQTQLRESLIQQAFTMEPGFMLLLILNFLAVAIVAFLFARSQFNPLQHLTTCLHEYAENPRILATSHLGPFALQVSHFLEVLDLRIRGESQDKIRVALDKADKNWPVGPNVVWPDLAQFMVTAALLSVFFCAFCAIFFMKISIRMVDLANMLVRFKVPAAPQFFAVQSEQVTLVLWAILSITGLAFVFAGYRFGKRMAEANFIILRDLNTFMHGHYAQRIFLRSSDPASEFAPPINEALDRIARQLQQ